jgi:hypothetical protein
MNSTELAAAIQKLSGELDSLIRNSLIRNNGLSAIEHELMKHKCTALYDLLLQFTPNEQESKPETEIVVTSLTKENPPAATLFSAPVPLINDLTDQQAPSQKGLATFTAEDIVTEEKTETEKQNEIIDEIIEQKIEEEIQGKPIPMLKEVLNELSLHEKIASVLPPKPDLTERIISNISSLKSAINVNLKIAMVNELFNESSVEYVKAIDKLNTSENIHEAMRYFSELKHTYNWDSDHALVKELETLITKRYSA